MKQQVSWQALYFSELSTIQLYECLKLRVDVFVVEQNCPYPELDDLDTLQSTVHLLGYEGDKLVAYCRLLAPGAVYDQYCAIGRVAVAQTNRQDGIGRVLMNEAIRATKQYWPKAACKISAQFYLQQFYQSLGFENCSDIYLEDGIEHIAMLLK